MEWHKKNRWYYDNATSVGKPHFAIFPNNSKQAITNAVWTIVYLIYLKQLLSMVVYTDDFTFSITYKTDGRDSVCKRYCVFLALHYCFPIRVFVTDVFLIIAFINRLCVYSLKVYQK